MTDRNNSLVEYVRQLLASQRANLIGTEIIAIEQTGDNWYAMTLAQLFANLRSEHSLLWSEAVRPLEHPATWTSQPRLLAWRVRNIVEIVIWISYSLHGKDNARRLYGDKTRDHLDLIKPIEKLIDVLQKFPVVASTNFDTLLANLQTCRLDLRTQAEAEGLDDLDESYTELRDAASILGPELKTTFLSIYKFLSKMTHPTALMISTPVSETFFQQAQEALLIIGATFFLIGFLQFETFFFPETANQPLLLFAADIAGEDKGTLG
jgi:hypothetical protein